MKNRCPARPAAAATSTRGGRSPSVRLARGPHAQRRRPGQGLIRSLPGSQQRPAARPRPRAGPAIFAPPLPRAAARCSPCAHGLPGALAAPVLSPGVVGHVPDEQRRVGGAQVAGHDGCGFWASGTNGLSKPSAAPAADHIHSHTLSQSQRAPLRQLPLLARFRSRLHSPSHLPPRQHRHGQRLFPARSLGARLRALRPEARAARPPSHSLAPGACSSPPPQRVLSFL